MNIEPKRYDMDDMIIQSDGNVFAFINKNTPKQHENSIRINGLRAENEKLCLNSILLLTEVPTSGLVDCSM